MQHLNNMDSEAAKAFAIAVGVLVMALVGAIIYGACKELEYRFDHPRHSSSDWHWDASETPTTPTDQRTAVGARTKRTTRVYQQKPQQRTWFG